jgi:hypothetical protein
MAHPARILAAALLAAVLAAPATLQASGLPDSRLAARGVSSASLRPANAWSFDWLFRLLRQVLPNPSPAPSDAGGGLDPNGGR